VAQLGPTFVRWCRLVFGVFMLRRAPTYSTQVVCWTSYSGSFRTFPGSTLLRLAAVATFGREGLDQLMPGTPPRVTILYNGQPQEVS